MEPNDVHSLTAAYALDALDEPDERAYTAHLRECPRCRAELRDLTGAATALAYAVEPRDPPAALRSRILEQARNERSNVVPLRPRRLPLLATVAAAAAAAVALGLGVWANSLSDDLDRERAVVDVLGDPAARRIPISGADGTLVVARDGSAMLVLDVPAAPTGKTYEAWIGVGGSVRPAGLFSGSHERDLVRLTERVPARASVLVTVEQAGGVEQPSTRPIFTARA